MSSGSAIGNGGGQDAAVPGSGSSGSGSGVSIDGAPGSPSDGGRGDDGGPALDGSVATGCPLGAILCEDFEKYLLGTTNLTPDWLTYTYGGGTLQVDTTKAHAGTKSLHLTTPVGGRKYADIIRQNPPDKELLPLRHYGRVMVWVTALPSAAHWNINQAGGPLAANPNLIGKYSYGGQNGVLSPNYTQRAPVGDGLMPLRGGGPENGDPNAALVDCGPNAATQKLVTNQWVCWEWMFDGQTNQQHLFLDGKEQTEAAVTGVPGTCGGWQGPKAFTKIIVGWEQYTQPSDKPQEAFLDDLVVSNQRVGCPP